MWKNDPALGAIPKAGQGSVDIGQRTRCGEAVIFDGTNVDELIDFLGDDALVQFEGGLYSRGDFGSLHPAQLGTPCVVVKPPAGDWFVLDEPTLMQEYAIVVTVPNQIHGSAPAVSKTMPTGTIAHTVDLGTAKKAPVKKAAAKKAPAKKAATKR